MGEKKPPKRVVFHGKAPGDSTAQSAEAASTSGHRYIYLLSPAHAGGKRARMLFRPEAQFELAERLRTTGISLGEAFSFMSPLYFRGKLAYASAFSASPPDIPGTLLITPSRGLLRPETNVSFADLTKLAEVRIKAQDPAYRDSLERDLRRLSETIGRDFRVVLLGSIATRKYIPLLLEILGERLLVPRKFIGMGNMSRGALLLRCSRERCELEYVTVAQMLSQET
jgi:hypothetical protein